MIFLQRGCVIFFVKRLHDFFVEELCDFLLLRDFLCGEVA